MAIAAESGDDARVTVSSRFQPRRAILELGDHFYDAVAPATFPRHILRFRNDRAAGTVGLDTLTDAEWIDHFGRFTPLPGSLAEPLALRYHGHQFRSYNPDLGDGRGFLFAQMNDNAGRLLDLGTKGSGQTPWSRFGDGRLTLKGGVREILASEMLEALGVATSRGFSLIETGEALERGDEPSPTRSSVLVRLSHGHIRYGTFQRLATLGQTDNIRKLSRYVLVHLAGQEPGAEPEAQLLAHAVEGAARLVSQWHVAGFVHGVLNTDNISLTSESFDYGPWRFLPRFDPGFTAAYFDTLGLYAFGRQAEALQWNLGQLAGALGRAAPVEALIPALEPLPQRISTYYRRQVMWRLGLKRAAESAEAGLIRAFETGLRESGIQPDLAWYQFRGGRVPENPHPAFSPFVEKLPGFTPAPDALAHPYWHRGTPETMLIEDVEAVWEPVATKDDWQPFEAKIAAIRAMGAAHRQPFSAWRARPAPTPGPSAPEGRQHALSPGPKTRFPE